LDEKQSKYKEVHKQLRLEFIAKRDKYAKIKAIEELYNISEVSQEVYDRKLFGSLNQFNTLLSEKVKPFLSIHQHIKKIYINDKFKVILEDEKGSFLEMELLSAGQKQILSFILISSILEFKKFVDFIFIDTPFGRLSNKSRDFIFNNYYLKFSYLTLLVTSSEYDYIEQQESSFKEYTIERNKLGSTIGVVKND
jgi:DNA sulfur modification protein DndD